MGREGERRGIEIHDVIATKFLNLNWIKINIIDFIEFDGKIVLKLWFTNSLNSLESNDSLTEDVYQIFWISYIYTIVQKL